MKPLILAILLLSACATKPADSNALPSDWKTNPAWSLWKQRHYAHADRWNDLYEQWEKEMDVIMVMPDGPALDDAYDKWDKKWDKPFSDWIEQRTLLEKDRPDRVNIEDDRRRSP